VCGKNSQFSRILIDFSQRDLFCHYTCNAELILTVHSIYGAFLDFSLLVRAFFVTLFDIFQPKLRKVALPILGAAFATTVGLVTCFGWVFWANDRILFWINIPNGLKSHLDRMGEDVVQYFTWMLYPTVITATLSLFIEPLLDAVEKLYYPDLPNIPVSRGRMITKNFSCTMWIALLAIPLNVLAMPIYFNIPLMGMLLFLAMNGYLLGLTYFNLIAMRRLTITEKRVFRRSNWLTIFASGIIISAAYMIPLINLFTPVFASILMLHNFELMQRKLLRSYWFYENNTSSYDTEADSSRKNISFASKNVDDSTRLQK